MRIEETRIPKHNALCVYLTNYKTSIQSTPFQLAFGLKAIMLVEFQVPSLWIQVWDRLSEDKSEQI